MATIVGAKSGANLVEELDVLRAEYRKVYPYRPRQFKSREEGADRMRRSLKGGTFTHSFAGEQYLNCPVKQVRRKQLQKLIDEGGQVHFGGPVVSHPTLARWEAEGYGLTPEEIARLERADYEPAELIHRGWRISVCRNSHFSVALGTSYVGEGETFLHAKARQAEGQEIKRQFEAWGVADAEKAAANAIVHAEADEDHGEFNQRVIREYCDTPELQAEMRRVFELRIHSWMGTF